MKERNRLAASLLSGADYEGATETHFFVRPATDMARDYIMKRHRAVFEEVMTELAGHPLTIVCTGGEEDTPPAPPAPASVTELLKIAGEGARVEEIAASAERPAPTPQPPALPKPTLPPAEEAAVYEVYEPTADEEAEMFALDELPPDADT